MNLEDRTFQLVEKMYSEMTERFDAIDRKLDTKADKNDIIRLGDEHGRKIDALFDGYDHIYCGLKQLEKGQEEIKSQLSDISLKIERQDLEITVIKRKKKSLK